jgi:hypothetical protein
LTCCHVSGRAKYGLSPYQLSPFSAACPALILATAAAFDSFVLTST